MKRFLIAAAFVVAFGLGSLSKAHAQIIYGVTVPANRSVDVTETTFTPSGARTFSSFFSAFTGHIQTAEIVGTPFGNRMASNNISPPLITVGHSFNSEVFANPSTRAFGFNNSFESQSFSTRSFGNMNMRSFENMNSRAFGSNPFTGRSFGTGFSTPNPFMTPFREFNSGGMGMPAGMGMRRR